ncbi:tRNA (guanosine(46)-N7)-methyltransferase TrmB [Aeromicrobium sp. Root495]|uniref:tRNA (guanosine(46)-N7)-methyltransferase TrmB n=1 Tax=Aeromicrobium sp. Root495 TaxID=1736550 RepID=UPI0009EA7F46|nr:tRNA (guanosine(46)-N7)-methyltransferase TrmB [Aeromicrobium sp. Root495]
MPAPADVPRDPASALPSQAPEHPRILSFTRRGGRISERQQAAWDEVGHRFVLDLPRDGLSTSVDPDFVLDPAEAFGREAPLVVEIGTGRGESIAHAAEQHPEINFLGLEVYVPGVASTLSKLRHRRIENVRLGIVDAAEALSTMLPEHSVREVWLWFPDPWPKKKHHKRRLVSLDFVPLVTRVLEPGGTWRMATDWAEYGEQMAEVVAASPLVEGGRVERYEGRVLTRFESKGLDVDREIHDVVARPV